MAASTDVHPLIVANDDYVMPTNDPSDSAVAMTPPKPSAVRSKAAEHTPTPPSDEIWRAVIEAIAEYSSARGALIEGEGMVGNFILPSANEVRNGWDDLAKVLAHWVKDADFVPLLAEAKRHFRRARSEVFETILITRLDTLREILDSLKKDPEFRVAKATHYTALQQAQERGMIAGKRAREVKGVDPADAIKKAKAGITVVQGAIDAFMKKAGEFELATEVKAIADEQTEMREEHTTILEEQKIGTRLSVIQIVLGMLLFLLGIVAQKYLLSP